MQQLVGMIDNGWILFGERKKIRWVLHELFNDKDGAQQTLSSCLIFQGTLFVISELGVQLAPLSWKKSFRPFFTVGEKILGEM